MGNLMKLNLGCGFNKIDGFINVDKFNTCEPDLVVDLEAVPWPFKTNGVDEVLFNHSLEHLGQETGTFLEIIKELHRVCKPGAVVRINAPHPRHDTFLGDPTHVRVITPETLATFSKRQNLLWKEKRCSNSPLALYLDVDFDVTSIEYAVEDRYLKMLHAKQISQEELEVIAKERNNVILEYRVTLQAVK